MRGPYLDTSIHHFVVLIRHGCNVLFTQMLSTHRAMVRSSLDFPDTFEIKDIRQNSFTVDVEVYGMVSELIIICDNSTIWLLEVKSF